jgi:hypothetical protein
VCLIFYLLRILSRQFQGSAAGKGQYS